eukprot:CAMPEP_0173389888 /NCGR_PEP_ID=MMETSP1356-20130122/13870_1 /TAXON_ID=77927 ORGANISM="Hemiselmis virescens, Strain PCC157" /NCGR_SAMPLE_ID=MMETSP1356 /ASSEMBLY_ACC=CAM_ASM_000847 /LENGTH=69 /DNA_ID=CAMNT_0014347165 /DNA_START=105 /DNA_END=310 /DNA_ORIENTATION=+
MWGNIGVSASGAVAKAVLRSTFAGGKEGAKSAWMNMEQTSSTRITAAQAAARRPPRVVLSREFKLKDGG